MSRPLAAILADLGLTTNRSDILWAWCAHRNELRKRERRGLDYAKGIAMHARNKRSRAGGFAHVRATERMFKARLDELHQVDAEIKALLAELEAT